MIKHLVKIGMCTNAAKFFELDDYSIGMCVGEIFTNEVFVEIMKRNF